MAISSGPSAGDAFRSSRARRVVSLIAQRSLPFRSSTISRPSPEPTYTLPAASTAGEERIGFSVS